MRMIPLKEKWIMISKASHTHHNTPKNCIDDYARMRLEGIRKPI
jgi:hypothetical protein